MEQMVNIFGSQGSRNEPNGPPPFCQRPKGRRGKTWAHDSAACRENGSQEITDNTANVEQRHHVHYGTSQPNRYDHWLRHTHYRHRLPSIPTTSSLQGRR